MRKRKPTLRIDLSHKITDKSVFIGYLLPFLCEPRHEILTWNDFILLILKYTYTCITMFVRVFFDGSTGFQK
jgi:hypothetical protein